MLPALAAKHAPCERALHVPGEARGDHLEGSARVRDPDTVVVGDQCEIRARRFVIATGSSPALPPIGLGQHDAEFDRVFVETFQRIVLRGQKPRPVLDREAGLLNRLMTETGAPCWQPDPPSTGACQVQ